MQSRYSSNTASKGSSGTKGADDIRALLSILMAATAPPMTLSDFLVKAHKDVDAVVHELNTFASSRAGAVVHKILDAIAAEYPAGFELCGARQAKLFNWIGESGAVIENVFAKLDEPTKG